MKKNVLIVEDKKAHMEHLCDILDGLNKDMEVFGAYDTDSAYQIAMDNHIHLFLIDIILNADNPCDVAGLNFVKEIRDVKKYAFTPVIFTTSLEDPELYSFKHLHCYEFIEKPYDDRQVAKAVLRALDFPVETDEERSVYFRKDGIVYAQRVKDIIYIENSRRRIVVHSMNDELEIPYKTFAEILKELDSDRFVQCSRFAVVNRNFIEQIDYTNRFIKLRHIDEEVEIGVMMKEKFKRRMENGLGNS